MSMDQPALGALLDQLIANWEDEVVEFKRGKDSYSSSDLGKYLSALANEANLRGKDRGWIVFGVDDKTRKVVVVFGGANLTIGAGAIQPNDETWEWSPQTSKWTRRVGTGAAPEPRAGAGMVYDSQRQKCILFGGRSAAGTNYDDTWEWDGDDWSCLVNCN